MDLVVVESPTKAKTLSKFLGKDFEVMATMGHIKDLPKSKLGVDVENNFKPDYVPVVKRESVILELIRQAKKAKKVFLASDPDREGEAIAQHVFEVLRSNGKSQMANDKFKRISFHEITKEAVEEAIANPRDIDKNLVDAQTGRRVLDRLVGYELSPLLWKKVRRGLSAGRVQSVTVKLIVEKEREIEAFKTEEYWEIYCDIKRKVGKKENFTVQLTKEEVKNNKRADEIVEELKKSNYKVLDVKKREVVKKSYPPFTTSTMSQAGARLFGWSAKRTMRAAQKLYEEGLITYHRTDSFNISQTAIAKAREFIKKTYGEKYLPESPKYYKTTSKVAQEAHEAIRPTNLNEKVEIASDENKLYDIIFRRFVACQMTASIYDETVIDVCAGEYLLRASGQIMKFDGWRKLFPRDESSIALPDVKVEEVLDLIKVNPIQKFTEPPPRFNEASLIKMLEKLGIGRPSTYAPIISTIQIRNYVEKDEGKFTPTLVGVAVNDFLVKNFPEELEYQFTAEMEEDLDNIANGEKKWTDTIKKFWGPFSKKVKVVTKEGKRVKIETEKLGVKCPECKEGELVIRIGRFGKFISCSRFPDCKHTEKYLEKTGAKCPDCKEGDVIIKRSGRGRKFFGCSRYPDCKWASWRKPELKKL
ncbi:MAG: type I DNA topoisomerase [Candidatus Woesebacteria bacterium]|nr:type I DNA topoisomerase [Candidatus Woesebacteria bacterium]